MSALHGQALAPFRVRSFRYQWPADLLTYWAFEMELLILGWYVLVETGSVLMLTVFAALQYVGTLAAPMFGVMGDRLGNRNLLAVMRTVYSAVAATLMLLAFTGTITPPLVILLAGLAGLVRSSDQGVRAAVVAETVPSLHLASAMAISRTTFDSARIAGALAGAGLIALVGMGPAYLMVTTFYALGGLLLLGVANVRRESVSDPAGTAAASPWSELREGLAYVWNTPSLLAAMCIAFLVNLAAFPMAIGVLPYVVREVYQADQTVLGYLAASFSLGGLTGSILLTVAGSRIQSGRMMVLFAGGWFAMMLAFAQTTSVGAGLATLVIAGFMQTMCLVPLSVLLLRVGGPQFRARVMGVRMLAINGLPIGLLLAGAMIGNFGFQPTASLYAAVGLTVIAAIGLRWRADLLPRTVPANSP